jgi:hypothetical protein
MSDSNQSAGETGGKGGGRKRKRSYRNRRRGRKPQNERNESRNNESRTTDSRTSDSGTNDARTADSRNQEEGGRSRSRSNRRGGSRGRGKNNDAGLDPVKRARRERRRRKRGGGRTEFDEDVVAVEPMPDLEIEPKRVFVYTHVLRPALRDAYEYRSEHFSHTGRTLEDFHIDLSAILIYPDDNPENEPIIDLHIGGTGDAIVGEEADWDDEEPFGDESMM